MVADSQFGVWLRRYDFDIIAESFDRTADWLNQCQQKVEEAEAEGEEPDPRYCKTKLDVVKYASGVMVKKKAEEGAQWLNPSTKYSTASGRGYLASLPVQYTCG